MRSASARAAFTIDSACSRWVCADCARLGRNGPTDAGSGGNCWKSKAGLYELVIVVVLRAPDPQRPGLLELADGADDVPLRLLHHAPALRRLELDLLHEHLGAALGHVPHDLFPHL